MLLTRAPLASGPEGPSSFDLHVLSLPPAFVLSQDQTLKLIGASLAHHVRITINREASQLLVYVWILRKRPSSTERRLRIPFVQLFTMSNIAPTWPPEARQIWRKTGPFREVIVSTPRRWEAGF